jgi:hypothetical protein
MVLGLTTSARSCRGRTSPGDGASWPGMGVPSTSRGADTTKGRRRVLAGRGGFGRGGCSLPEVHGSSGMEDVSMPKMPRGCGTPEMARDGGAEVVLPWRANSGFRFSIRVDRRQWHALRRWWCGDGGGEQWWRGGSRPRRW